MSDLPATPATAHLPAHLAAPASRYVEAGLRGAANTQRAYAGDWRRFTAWCQTHELESLQSPTADSKIKVLLKGITREKKTRMKQAPAFTLASFKRTVKSIDVSTYAGLRDRALLLLGFTGAFRRAELSALNVEDLTFDEEGLIIAFNQSKTNQTGQADEKAIYYSPELATCPVRSLQAWLRASAADRMSGPVFVSLRKSNQLTSRRLTPEHINLLTKRYLGSGYTAHSLRASFVTVAKLNGADDSEIMNQTKHKTSAMIRRYTRLDNVRQHNAGKKLGL